MKKFLPRFPVALECAGKKVLDLGCEMRTMVLRAAARHLKPKGRLFVGFAPLWRCVRGDQSIENCGLNMLRLANLRKMFSRTGLCCSWLRVNVSLRIGLKLYNLGRFIPGLGEYFTHKVCAVVHKAGGSSGA